MFYYVVEMERPITQSKILIWMSIDEAYLYSWLGRVQGGKTIKGVAHTNVNHPWRGSKMKVSSSISRKIRVNPLMSIGNAKRAVSESVNNNWLAKTD